MRVIRRAVHARSRFSAVKRHQGTSAAVLSLVSHLVHAVTIPAARALRRIGRLEDLVALLPLPNLHMRHDVLFIGYLEAGLGLGESLRGLVRSLTSTGLPFALYPFKVGVETRRIGGFMEDRYDLKHRHKVNVIEVPADQLPGLFREIGRWKMGHSYNILRTYWELPKAPAEWAPLLKGIHEIWAPNEFVANAFREIFDGPIKIVPPCVEIGTENAFDREQLGMDQDKFYFMFSFDYFSYPDRKNPLGVVRAFQAAFPNPDEKVGLVIKSTSATDQYLEIKSAILEAARHDQRIKVIDRTLPRDEMLSLIGQSDCYISLHRSEGFGLGMAEAMAFGKPVIGTDYSGCTEFLSDRTGFPVSFTLRPVQPDEYVFADGQSWAEPDGASAVEAMQRVVYDQQERQIRSAAGRAFVQAHYGRDNIGRIAARHLQEVLAASNCAHSLTVPSAAPRPSTQNR